MPSPSGEIWRAFFHIIPVTRTAKIYEIDFDLSENGSVRIVLFSDYPGNSFSFPTLSSEGASCLLYFKQTGTGRLINGMVRKCFEFVGSEPADSRYPYPVILLLGTLSSQSLIFQESFLKTISHLQPERNTQ